MNPERLAELERLFCQSELARGLFHEINNCLARILACTQLFMVSSQERKMESHDLKAIEQEVYRLRKMMQSFMNLFASNPDFEGLLEMNSLLTLLLHSIQDQPSFSHIDIVKEFSPGELRFQGNLDQWRAVLVGLLLKAGRSMQRGDLLRVSTSQDAGGTFKVIIKISRAKAGERAMPQPFLPYPSSGGRVRDLAVYLAQRTARQSGGSLKVKYLPTGLYISLSLPSLEGG